VLAVFDNSYVLFTLNIKYSTTIANTYMNNSQYFGFNGSADISICSTLYT